MRALNGPRIVLAVYLFALSGAAVSQNAVTNDSADVYAGPDDSYPVVAQLDVDSPIEVNGCLNDWSWCDVSFADSRGWVYAPYITYEYEGGYVPFYTYAPSFGVPIVEFSVGSYWDRYYRDRPWYARREEWLEREPHHRRPSGPPPSVSPPPRSARMDRPPRDGRPTHDQSDRSFRLGSAEPPHAPGRAEPPRATERPRAAEPPRTTEPPRATESPRAGEPPHVPGRAGPPDVAEPPHTGRAGPPQAPGRAEPPRPMERAEPPRAPEPPRAEPPGEEHSNTRPEPPHREDHAITPQRPAGPPRDERARHENGPGEPPR